MIIFSNTFMWNITQVGQHNINYKTRYGGLEYEFSISQQISHLEQSEHTF